LVLPFLETFTCVCWTIPFEVWTRRTCTRSYNRYATAHRYIGFFFHHFGTWSESKLNLDPTGKKSSL
jgi:hypothetical protein